MVERVHPTDETELEERIHRYGRLLSGIPWVDGEPAEVTARRCRWEAERDEKRAELKTLITKRENV